MTQRRDQIQQEIEKRTSFEQSSPKRAKTDEGEVADILILEKNDGENTIVLRHGEFVVRKRCVVFN